MVDSGAAPADAGRCIATIPLLTNRGGHGTMGTIVMRAASEFNVVPGEFAARQTPKLDAICGDMGTIVMEVAGKSMVVPGEFA